MPGPGQFGRRPFGNNKAPIKKGNTAGYTESARNIMGY
jgi:hypothetical protein